jgi:hypothetical protein
MKLIKNLASLLIMKMKTLGFFPCFQLRQLGAEFGA